MTAGSGHRQGKRGAARLATLVLAMAALAATVCYTGRQGARGNPFVKVVQIELGPGVQVRPVLISNERSRTESFVKIVDRLRPYAAINGTYDDENMKPIGDILIDGRLTNRGCQRNAIAVTRRGEIVFMRRGKRGFRWAGCRAGLAAGPRLVHEGRIALDPVADGFSHQSLKIRSSRSGVGVTNNKKLLLVTARQAITLSQFAKVMLDLGAVEAMNLDGGGACALYHEGRTLVFPTLPMTNLLVVYKNNRSR